MKEEKNIEQIFKDAFSNYEAPVDPALWQNIENSIHPSAVNPLEKTVSATAQKTIAVKAVTWIAGVALIASGIYYLANRSDKTPETKTTISTEQKTTLPKVQTPSDHKVAEAKPAQQNEKKKTQHTTVKEKAAEQKLSNILSDEKTSAEPVVNSSTKTQEKTIVPAADKDRNTVKPEAVQNVTPIPTPAATENNAKPVEPAAQNTKPETVTIPGLSNTVFTPNGDGIGDVFDFDDSYLSEVNVKIYNSKNYKLVYEWSLPGGSWDGRLKNGNNAEEGIYIVMINGKGYDGKIYKSTIKLQLRRN